MTQQYVQIKPLTITEKQLVVLRMLAHGMRNPQIAAAIACSEKTVKNHLLRIYAMLDVDNRTAAVLKAIRLGIIEMPSEDAK
jgi:DNA-binding NarL/FixJ family response regulator